MRRCSGALGAAIVVALLASCRRDAPARGITVFAAASLVDLVEQAAARTRESGVEVTVTTGGSSMLARQIARGAPADVFLSADPGWIDHVVRSGRGDAGSRRVFATNRLVVVVPRGRAPPTLESLASCARIAIADPASVPAGVYARRALEARGVWASVEPRLVPVLDARAALRLAADGAVDAAFVYATDARASDAVDVALIELPVAGGVRYELVVVDRDSDRVVVDAFVRRATDRASLERLGFAPASR